MKLHVFYAMCAACIAASPTRLSAAEIEVQPYISLGVEMEFSFDLSGRNLCTLELWLEDEAEKRSRYTTVSVSHRVADGPDDDSPIIPIVKPQPFEKYYVRDLSAMGLRSGVKTIYREELPYVKGNWVQLYLKGFDCSAFPDDGSGLDLDKVDFMTLAPKTVAPKDLIEIRSEVFRIDLR